MKKCYNHGVPGCPLCIEGVPHSLHVIPGEGGVILAQEPKVSRRQRNHTNKEKVVGVHAGIDVLPADYLARNQHEPERAAKIVTQAHERKLARNARRLKHAEASGQRRPVFKVDMRKAAQ